MIPIPAEITDIIIGSTQAGLAIPHLDKETLAACSLVRRSWRSFAQERLFEDVWINVKRPLDQFPTFLESKPRLAAAIRLLCLYHRAPPDPEEWDEEPNDGTHGQVDDHALSPVLVMKIATMLSIKAQLKLEGISLLGWPTDAPLPSTPLRLKGLILTGVVHKPYALPHAMAFDISSFFELDEIYFVGGRMIDAPDAPSSDVLALPVATRPAARAVHVYGRADGFAACNLQCGGFDPGRLEALCFSPNDFASLQFAGMLLRLHADSVRSVELAVSGVLTAEEAADASIWEAFSVASCTCLVSLKLSWNHYGFRPDDRQDLEACDAMGAILASTPSTLRRLTFSLPYMQSPDKLRRTLEILVPRIEQALDKFRKLQSVTLEVTRSFAADKCTEIARSTLPTSHLDSGMLRVEHKSFFF